MSAALPSCLWLGYGTLKSGGGWSGEDGKVEEVCGEDEGGPEKEGGRKARRGKGLAFGGKMRL